MITTLIFAAMLVIGIAMLVKSDYYDVSSTIGMILTVLGGCILFVCLMVITSEHIGVSVKIAENNIQYESLCERQEIIDSQYEDVSRSDIIKDVAEWNVKVHNYQYWTYNPWTNWFHSKRLADSMKMIGSE